MKRLATLFAVFQLLFLSSPALAQLMSETYGSTRTVITESWVEEWDPVAQEWVRIDEDPQSVSAPMPTVTSTYAGDMLVSETRQAARYAQPIVPIAQDAIIARYGPFVVTGDTTAAIIGPTNSASPAHFDAMLRDFPELSLLEMIEAPGTSNDIANLAVGRRIREAGLSTHVPRGGSVRSGAVELFLAGATRTMDDSAQFAVHSWLDNHGRQADDFAVDHPAHRLYLDYYTEMGMSERQARDFYAMTNSVPHESALWLDAAQMRPWVPQGVEAATTFDSADQIARDAADFVQALPGAIMLNTDWYANVPVSSRPALARPALGYGDVSTMTLAALDVSHVDSGATFP